MTPTKAILAALVLISIALAAIAVPPAIQMPGTQPGQAGNLETPDKCENCHGGYNRAVEPAFNWRGSMMANATRDPIFWATLAIAEQDFDGVGDMCIRCHSTSGWYAGRATPTDGSRLMAGDADGVECDSCHKMANPDNSEHQGVMTAPFIANNGVEGFYGSGMLSRMSGSTKYGPYAQTTARHQFSQSRFHRSEDFCGSCHDVSNPVTGDLAHNQGRQSTSGQAVSSDLLTSPLTAKAAFNNLPYQYGVVERTFSEFKSSAISKTRVSAYTSLPADLQAGALKSIYDTAGGDYEDGTPRYYTCQSCHVRAVTGAGADKANTPIRRDLPLHDMTGGNYWVPEAILYQNARGLLRLGGRLSTVQIEAIQAGADRARQQLDLAATLTVTGSKLKVTNHTGHKLISGYPEGRRMWVNIKWYGSSNNLLRENGKYDVVASVGGVPVKSLVDPYDAQTRVYEAHYGMTREWAVQLLGLGYSANLPLSFNRVNGAVTKTLGQLAAQPAGTSQDTFHFVLNNTVTKDNRIPPYGYSYDEALKRNALPVVGGAPAGRPDGGVFNYWDEFEMEPPPGAVYAEIKLLYQPTSWEYVQFLHLANNRSVPFLADQGENLLNTWLNTGQAEPHVMATATWRAGGEGVPPPPPSACPTPATPAGLSATAGKKKITLSWNAVPDASGYKVSYDQGGKYQLIATVPDTNYTDNRLTSRISYTYVVAAVNDCGGESAPSAPETATAQ